MRALIDAHSILLSEQKVQDLANSASALKQFDNAFPEEAGVQYKITPENAQIISALWNDPAIQKTYEERSSFQISDSTDYFFDPQNLTRISKPGYMPDNMDVLRTRIRTSGIIENSYMVEDSEFLVIDVGGQRTERGKWIYVFADVDAIVYVASLSGYDQKLYEDETQNRMVEALQLFKEIVNLTLFPPECAIILFPNNGPSGSDPPSNATDVHWTISVERIRAHCAGRRMAESATDQKMRRISTSRFAILPSTIPK